MELAIYQVDAFTSRLFGGNPAAIVPLESAWLPDAILQSIAAENNLAETAYFIPRGGDRYDLRWFTPGQEVDLCGHATLASAHIIFQHLQPELTRAAFETKSGELVVTRDGGMLSMDFPSRPPEPGAVDSRLRQAIGGKPSVILAARDYFVVYGTEAEVRALAPDMRELKQLDRWGIIATAPGGDSGVDFVSRFFAPAAGVDEDPVTGSSHCTLIPYWAQQLGKTKLVAKQISPRAGDLWCGLDGNRVTIAGHAVEYLKGTIQIPD